MVASTKFCGILQASARTNQVNKASRFEAALYSMIAVFRIRKGFGPPGSGSVRQKAKKFKKFLFL